MKQLFFSILSLLLFTVILSSCGSKKEGEENAVSQDTLQNTVTAPDSSTFTNTVPGTETPPVTTENPAELPQSTNKVNPTTPGNNTPVKPSTAKTSSADPKNTPPPPPVKSSGNPTTPQSPNQTSTGAVIPPAPGTNPPPRPKSPPAEAPKSEPQKMQDPSPKKPDLSHSVFNNLLKKYVSSTGKVDYKGIKSEKDKLYEYLEVLEANPPQQSWDRNKRLAYWINAYNANTIKMIIENYPTSSITKITAKPWDQAIAKIGDKTYTLNQIENEIIRPTFKEPRIHFAVNCAAKSCPKLHNEAFMPEKLDAQLEKMAKAFINNKEANVISEKKAELSKIFEWYKDDFAAAGGVIAFINKYSDVEVKDNAKVTYREYDWNLNE